MAENTFLMSRIDELLRIGCNSVYLLHLYTGEMEPYLYHNEVAQVMTTIIDSKVSYEEIFDYYTKRFVVPREQMDFHENSELAFLRDRLRENGEYSYKYHRYTLQHELERVEMCVDKLDDSNQLAIMWFRNVDNSNSHMVDGQIGPHRRNLLVIENNRIAREALTNLLSREYNVLTADNGEDGLSMLKNNNRMISVILLDVDLPDMDGYELLKTIAEDATLSTIPVITTSGGEDESTAERRCLQLGAVDFISKPYNPEVTLTRVRNAIKMRESAIILAALEYDGLTGLYTREAFFRHVESKLKSDRNKSYDFIVLDIDNFGLINQQYSMDMGDRVLEVIGQNLKSFASKDFIAARVRDDLFAVLAAHSSDEVPEEHWNWGIGRSFVWNDENQDKVATKLLRGCPVKNLHVKFGVYKNVDPEQKAATLFLRVMMALDTVRDQFGTAFAFYDKKLIEKQERIRLMELSFEDALSEDGFELWIQPKYETDAEIICGAEALIRWRDPDGKLIPPSSFIQVFEKDGLIRKLDEYMFRRVCKYQKSLLDKNITIVPISVNLSCASLYRNDMAQLYEEIVNTIGIDPSYVPIEITETMAIQSTTVKDFAETLYKKGFSFHMDDFGSGYSSLSSLHTLPFDAIKLDKSLVDFIGTPGGNSILKHTIAFSKESGLKVVAEGVESADQRDFLMRMGCDCIQGYYYAAPMPMDMFEKLLTDNADVLDETEEDRKFAMLEKKQLLSIISNNMIEEDAINNIMGAVALCVREQGNIFLSAANAAFMDIFQIDEDFVHHELEQQFTNFVHYEDRTRFKRMFREAEKNSEKGAVMECRFVQNDRLIWCRIHCYFLRKNEGRKEYYTYVIDRTAAHFNNEILAGVPGGFLIYHADEEARIVFSNSQLWNIYGCETLEEFMIHVGSSFNGLVHPEDLPAVLASIDEQMINNNNKLDFVEYRIKKKDGSVGVVSDFGHMVHYDSGEDLFYVFISEKK